MDVQVTHKLDWGSIIAVAVIVFIGEYRGNRNNKSNLGSAECTNYKTPTEKARPKTISQRESLLSRYGRWAFLMPDGTPSRPGVPSYPIVTKEGCFHCGLGRAALTRIGQAINKRDYSEAYKRKLESARKRLIRTAMRHNCQWAFTSEKRFL